MDDRKQPLTPAFNRFRSGKPALSPSDGERENHRQPLSNFRQVKLALCAAAFIFPAVALAQDWPQFLGPHANGISDETGLLDKWPTNGPAVVWEKEIGAGYSAPSIREGFLVLHHRIGSEEIVEAFNATNGNSLWKYGYPSRFVDPYGYNNGPRCTPLLTPNYCYTFGAEGKLLCLELKTGKMVWQRDTGA